MVEQLLDIAGVKELVEEWTSASDAESSKPDPDIIEAALDNLGLAPDEVVMIGDTPYDIEAAAKANVGVIALRCGGFTDEELAGAIEIYDAPADLLARYHSSPLGRKAVVEELGHS
jgi:phosphoglycolate phosphatase-like HAD superfamily hydrolase